MSENSVAVDLAIWYSQHQYTLQLTRPTIEGIRAHITDNILASNDNRTYYIKYIDEDYDRVVLSSQTELDDAIAHNNTLTLYVDTTVSCDSSSEEDSGSEVSKSESDTDQHGVMSDDEHMTDSQVSQSHDATTLADSSVNNEVIAPPQSTLSHATDSHHMTAEQKQAAQQVYVDQYGADVQACATKLQAQLHILYGSDCDNLPPPQNAASVLKPTDGPVTSGAAIEQPTQASAIGVRKVQQQSIDMFVMLQQLASLAPTADLQDTRQHFYDHMLHDDHAAAAECAEAYFTALTNPPLHSRDFVADEQTSETADERSAPVFDGVAAIAAPPYDPFLYSPFQSATTSVAHSISCLADLAQTSSVCTDITEPSFAHDDVDNVFESFVEPSAELTSMHRDDSHVAASNITISNASVSTEQSAVLINVADTDKQYTLTCSLQSLDKRTLRIRVENECLHVIGQANTPAEPLTLQSANLSIRLPADVDADKITAKHNKRTSLYTVTLPKLTTSVASLSADIVEEVERQAYADNCWPDDSEMIASLFTAAIKSSSTSHVVRDSTAVDAGNISPLGDIESTSMSFPQRTGLIASPRSSAVVDIIMPQSHHAEELVDPNLLLVQHPAWHKLYSDHGSRASVDGSAYIAVPPPGYVSIGATFVAGYTEPTVSALFVLNDPLYVCVPVSYELLWNDRGSGGEHDVSIYRPIAPPLYTALGDVVVQGYDAPARDAIYCVRSDLLSIVSKRSLQFVWCNKGSRARSKVSVFNQPTLHTFYAVQHTLLTGWTTTPVEKYGHQYCTYVFASQPRVVRSNSEVESIDATRSRIQESSDALLDEQSDEFMHGDDADDVVNELFADDEYKQDVADDTTSNAAEAGSDGTSPTYAAVTIAGHQLARISSVEQLAQSPEVQAKLRHDELLMQLESMGFDDVEQNQHVLKRVHNLDDAVDWLIAMAASGVQHSEMCAQPEFF